MEDTSAATTTEVGAKEAAAASASASTPNNNNNNIRICLVGEVVDDEETLVAAKHFGVPLLTSETGEEYALGSNDQWITYFILKDFEGPLYEALSKSPNKVVGPPALKQFAKNWEPLPTTTRPVYNFSMKGVITCFTGIRKREELTRLVNLIHAMGGSIRKDMNSKVTHLICNAAGGDKYKYAITFRLGVVRPAWVEEAWKNRDAPEFMATKDDFTINHRLKVFEGQRICFTGFPPEEHKHMEEVLRSNGGIPSTVDNPECTHVIVDEQSIQVKVDVPSSKTFVLKADWFWYTIQNGYAEESDYLFDQYLESITNTPGTDRSDNLPMSMNKRKRKRLSQKVIKEECSTPKTTGKRRSSVSDAGLLSMSGSFLDCTVSPGKHNTTRGDDKLIASPAVSNLPVVKSMRFNHFMDFFQTESNYVGILDIIDKVFKEPLEKMVEGSAEEALLNRSEIKAIFGNFLPIHEVHKHMMSCLTTLHSNWSDSNLIGEVILKHRNDLLKAYPPYINFFEQMKEALAQCDRENPRFHAFLKINQSKPECGRQSLQDLMIRPVQRLPSISLLLNDILKHTPKQNPDAKCLEDALTAIKEIMTYINEDKRKTEGQMAMFDIFNEIENCPAHLVSSHRSFVSKCEVVELSDLCSGRGHCLIFFLFNDTIEVCKKRSRAFAAKSPNATFNSTLNQRSMQSHTILGAAGMGSSSSNSHSKPYKHIKMMPLNTIRVVVDIKDTPRAFALGCRMSKENKDKYYYFNLSEDMDLDKQTYLRSLCKQMAENACRADADKFYATVESQDLDFDFHAGTLSRAFKFANRTRLKVGRAFSFNKTPSKLKRAVSTIMTSPFGSTNSLTPASQMAQMKLASCNNINEIGEIEDDSNVSNSTTITGDPMHSSRQKTGLVKLGLM